MIGVKLLQLKKYVVNVEITSRDLKELEKFVKKIKKKKSPQYGFIHVKEKCICLNV